MEYELWAAIALLFLVAFHTTSGFVGEKMSLVDFAEFQSVPDELKKLYYATMLKVAPEAMKTVKADDIKKTADAALLQIKTAQLPGVNAVPILTPAPTVQATVDGWKGPIEAAKAAPAPVAKTPAAPAATPATPVAPAAPAASVAVVESGPPVVPIVIGGVAALAVAGYIKWKYF
jgi:hypothetical protein